MQGTYFQLSLVVNYYRCMEDSKRERGNELGPTARTVAANLKRLRSARGLTQAQLADALARLGHPVPAASVGKMELRLRRIEVDDLLALSLALKVSPLALLLPDPRRSSEGVEVTGRDDLSALQLWEWAVGGAALPDDDGHVETSAITLPWWLSVLADDRTANMDPSARESWQAFMESEREGRWRDG